MQRRVVLVAALALLSAPGCGDEASGRPTVDVTCGELRSDDSWREMATVEADLTTSGGPPLPASIKEYEENFRRACVGASDDFKPLNKAIELRLQCVRDSVREEG